MKHALLLLFAILLAGADAPQPAIPYFAFVRDVRVSQPDRQNFFVLDLRFGITPVTISAICGSTMEPRRFGMQFRSKAQGHRPNRLAQESLILAALSVIPSLTWTRAKSPNTTGSTCSSTRKTLWQPQLFLAKANRDRLRPNWRATRFLTSAANTWDQISY
jgi:hypothetical protein